MAEKNALYTLPIALGAALSSGRTELITVLIGDIKAGRLKFDKDQLVEIMRLIQGLIEDREEAKTREAELRRRFESSAQNIRGAIDALETAARQ